MKRADAFPPGSRAVPPVRPADPLEPAGDSDFIECPRCCSAPLRFISSGICSDSTGGGVYTCVACNFSSARDLLVERLLRRQRETEHLLEDVCRLVIPIMSACARGTPPAPTDPRFKLLRWLDELRGDHLTPTDESSRIPRE